MQNVSEDVLEILFEKIVTQLKHNQIYDANTLPKYALNLYYSKPKRHVDLLQKNFIEEYIYNESIVEESNNVIEIEGLRTVYEHIFKNPYSADFDVYLLKELHQLLYSHAPYPEKAGQFRTINARLDGSSVKLCPYEEIAKKIYLVNKDINKLIKNSDKAYDSSADLFDYIEKCIKLKCKLIYIHPFFDGNGRTVRAFINKMFALVGVPPIYVHEYDKKIYHMAMQKAIENGEYEDIINFYYAKICQSIYELDLNPSIDIQDKTDIRKIENIVLNYKHCLKDEKTYTHCAHQIKEHLDSENINSDIYKVLNDKDEEEYSYILAYIPHQNSSKTVLIDPFFSNYINQFQILLNKDESEENIHFLKKLYNKGFSKIDIQQLELYLNYFDELGEIKITKDKQKILTR